MLTVDEIKAQCRLDSSDESEDELLRLYANAAFSSIQTYLNRPLFADEVPDDSPNGIAVADDIRLAMLLLVGHWYENREPVTIGSTANSVPLSFEMLLRPHRLIPM